MDTWDRTMWLKLARNLLIFAGAVGLLGWIVDGGHEGDLLLLAVIALVNLGVVYLWRGAVYFGKQNRK